MAELPGQALPRVVWTVASLLGAVGDALASRFGACAVRGELSGFGKAPSGHCYFSLKDADGAPGALRCAMFRRAALLLPFEPRDGQLVELRGRLAVYEPRGELQFVAEAMMPAGAGALYEQFLRLKQRLTAEGLFDAARKRELPPFASNIGIVTSLSAAALQDVLSALARRAPHVRVIVYPSPVQGADAPDALARAIAVAGRRAEVDVLIVCRGGGSLEDLWAFNDERVVRAIVASAIPVVCGVGHETDVTLADFAADLRATTPTAAAEAVAPLRDELLAQLGGHARRLLRACALRLNMTQQRLDRVAACLARPAERVGREQLRLALLARRLPQSVAAALGSRRELLRQTGVKLVHAGALARARLSHREQQNATRLGALDPMQVVARGYALVHTGGGELVVSAAQIANGDTLHLTLARDDASVQISSVQRESRTAG